MDYTETKKAFRQIEDWRKYISKKEQRHINNITNKDILIYLARIEVKKLNIDDVSKCECGETKGLITICDDCCTQLCQAGM
jgi:hypothetical protein